MWRQRWQTIGLIGAVLLGAAQAAGAEPTEAERRAAAQALFDAGRQLATQESFPDACPKLLESYRLDAAIGTKFYLAECYEHIGRLASAWTYYLEVGEEAHREGSKDREKFAGQRAEALKPRLPRLRVKRGAAVRSLADLVVERDGLPVGEGMWDTPVPVDLGAHLVRATAPGKKPLEIRVEVKQEGAEVVVEIPALEEAPAALPASPLPPPPPPVEPPPPPPISATQRIAGFTIGAVGVAGVAAGIGFGVQAIAKKNASNAGGNCDASDACNALGRQLRVDSIHAATASTALFAVGGAALVAGIVLVATAPPRKPPREPAPSATLSLGPLGASLRGRF